MRLRIVVQRYGSEILGGAERHAALIASLLSPHHDLEVWTTTAGDYQTWSPAYPEGFSTIEGIRVRRFAVDTGRTERWGELSGLLHEGFEPSSFARLPRLRREQFAGRVRRWPLPLQEAFIREQGPEAGGLMRALEEESYDRVLFFTYLYPTTYDGLERVDPARARVVPTLHDEPTAYLPAFGARLERARLLCSTASERALLTRLYPERTIDSKVIGYGIDLPEAEGADPGSGLAEAIEKEIRARLVVRTKVEVVEFGSLPQTDYKTKLVATADNKVVSLHHCANCPNRGLRIPDIVADMGGEAYMPACSIYDTTAHVSYYSHAINDSLGNNDGIVDPGEPVAFVPTLKNIGALGATVISAEMDRELDPGEDEVGWFAMSGRVPLGYLGDADKTARTFPVVEGRRMSVPGDRARRLVDGRIEVLGRDSVTINSGGEKIFAEEVEVVVKTHPGVYDVVVCGRPSERWGNEVVAIVQPVSGHTIVEADVIAHGDGRIARYKRPKAVIVVETVKRSPAGKPDYRWAASVAVGGDA